MLEENITIKKTTAADTQTKPDLLKKDQRQMYDLIIIGAGMAGMTCAIYAARAELKILILESKITGGQITTTEVVENWPTQESIAGFEIGQKLQKQGEKLGIQVQWAIINKINKLDKIFVVSTEDNKIFNSRAVVLATGANPRELGIPGEKEYRGKGVSYCATCDGPFYKNKNIVVIGGGDSAVKEALYLAKIARQVTIIHRRDALRAEKIIGRKAIAHEKITVAWNTIAEEILGEGNMITGIKVKNVKTNEQKTIFADGVFIYVGIQANTAVANDLIELTEDGYVAAREDTKTKTPGLFAAGDIRKKPLRQLVTAASDGATAAMMVQEYLDII